MKSTNTVDVPEAAEHMLREFTHGFGRGDGAVTLLIAARLRPLLDEIPDTEWHRLIDAAALTLALKAAPMPSPGESCVCGRPFPIRPAAQGEEEGDEDLPEAVEVYELDYSVGWKPGELQVDSKGYRYAGSADSNDEHTVATMCAACYRLYVAPPEMRRDYS